jgi:hypothetical protein
MLGFMIFRSFMKHYQLRLVSTAGPWSLLKHLFYAVHFGPRDILIDRAMIVPTTPSVVIETI